MAQNKSLSTQEVADILHVSKSTIYDLIRRGEINSYKIGRKVRFTQDDVDAYIARSRHEHSTQPVKTVDTGSTLLTPADLGAPELIISGQDVVLTSWPTTSSRRGCLPGAPTCPALRGCWPCIRIRWMWQPAICMTAAAITPASSAALSPASPLCW